MDGRCDFNMSPEVPSRAYFFFFAGRGGGGGEGVALDD